MPILQPKTQKTSDKPANTPTVPNRLCEHYRAQWDIKLNKYKPSEKAFILANLLTEPTPEIVSSFIKSVAETAEAEFDSPQKNQ